MKKITFILLMFVVTCFTYGQTVTKTYTPQSPITVDGCGSYCVTLPGVTFTAADFPTGTVITDVNVSITWLKTDGSCGAPGTGNSFHNETNFRVNGPSTQSILAAPGTWSGGANSPVVTTVFDQAAGSVPSGTPISGTFLPNGGNLDVFNNSCSSIGTWSLSAGDTTGSNPLCISSYSITITAGPDTTPPTGTLVVPNPIAILDASGNSQQLNEADIVTNVTDNCGVASVTYRYPSGSANAPTGQPPIFTCADIGTVSLDVIITDDNTNVTTLVASIEVEDNIAPSIICPIDITVSNDSGNCSAIVLYTYPVATDNCNNATPVSLKQNNEIVNLSLDCIGTESGHLRIFNLVTEGVTEDYNITSIDVGIQFSNGLATDVLTVNIYTDNQVVNPFNTYSSPLTDSFAPHVTSGPIVVPAGTNYLLNVPLAANLIAGSTIYVEVLTAASADFLMGYGDNNLVPNGETVTGYISCSLGGGLPYGTPTFYGFPNFSAVITVNGEEITGVTTTQTAGLAPGDSFPLGTTTNTFLVTDASGNTATCSFDVTVEDNEAPVITCIADGTRDTDAGVCEYTIQGTEFDATFTDNCMSATITNDLNNTASIAGETLPIGDTTVIWTVNDGNGQTDTCTTIITVEDNEAPVITCIADGTRDTDAGVCEYTVQGTEFDAVFTDNCMSATITNDLNNTASIAGEVLPKGDTTVVWTVDDGNGQTATCTTIITVEDNESPTIVCSMDVDISTDPGVCGAEVNFPLAIALDNCGVVTVAQTGGLPSNSFFPVGVSTVEFTATDDSGNTSVCSFTITITDGEAPIAVCQDITVQLDAMGIATILPADVDGGSTDNCGILTTRVSQSTFGCADVGDVLVTLSVFDDEGNVGTCTATVTVEDNIAPVIACLDPLEVDLDSNGNATVNAADLLLNVDEACAWTATVTGNATIDFDCSNLGVNMIDVIVTDASGNTAICTATVNVNDVTAPVLVCADVTLELGPDGTLDVNPEDLLGISPTTYNVITISSDNQSNAEGFTDLTVDVTDAAAISFDWDYITTDGPAFDSFGVLLNGVYTEISDPNGALTQSGTYGLNVVPGDVFGFRSYSLDGSFGAATTTVSNFMPGFNGQFAPANWTELLTNSDGSATFVEITGGPLSFDACGITILAVDITEVTCADIGTPIVITVFASDASGNIAACQSTVTVVDLLAPVLTCPEDQTQDPGAGNVLWEVPDFFANGEATATDNCTDPVVIITQDPIAGTLLPDGIYTVTMTAEDEYGNIATCDFELTIESELGVGDHQDLGSIILYPNPANNIVRLSNPDSLELETLSVYDLTGRLVYTTNLEQMGTEISIDVSRYANATYMVIIKGTQGALTKQLIVNNY